MTSSRPPFKLHAEHAALDFVNTLDDRFAAGGAKELLPTYADLLRFCLESGVLAPAHARRLRALPEKARQDARRSAIDLRETLARVCYAMLDEKSPSVTDRAELVRWSMRCAQHREMSWTDGRLVWQWRNLERDAHAPALLLAQSALELLTADPPPPMGACASETCRWLFLDVSRNGTRRWCDMKTCGNRAKARRYSRAHGN